MSGFELLTIRLRTKQFVFAKALYNKSIGVLSCSKKINSAQIRPKQTFMPREKNNFDDRRYKGKVGVTTDKGMLRLILPRSVSGALPRKISLGLHDTPENREIAEAKAMVIQGDIKLGQLDKSLERYGLSSKRFRSSNSAPQKSELLSLTSLYEKYINLKKKALHNDGMIRIENSKL